MKDSQFEEKAIRYIEKNSLSNIKTQRVLYDLLMYYFSFTYSEEEQYCKIIKETKGLSIELYKIAAEYYSMIGEYDIADKLVEKTIKYCKQKDAIFLFSDREKMMEELEKRKNLILRYRNGQPFWPITEAKRKKIAKIYDQKGIKYDDYRMAPKPTAIKENEFKKITISKTQKVDDYCTFWCSGVKNYSSNYCIYQIAAVKIINNKIAEKFQEYIAPWDGAKVREQAAKEAKIDYNVLLKAKEVDIVMNQFFKFVQDYKLISTDAFGNQAKLITRAARYSGIKQIKNEFIDLLEYSADISEEFDLQNNTREYLLKYFSIKEGKDSVEKAIVNKKIYQKLKEIDK